MKLTTEFITKKQKAIIVSKRPHHFVSMLKEHLKNYDMHVHISPQLPHDINQYDACFFIQEPNVYISEFKEYTDKKFVFVFFNQDKLAHTYRAFAQDHYAYHIKVINLETSPQFFKDDIEAIVWFAFSRSGEIFLHIYHPTFSKPVPKAPPKIKQPPLSVRITTFLTPKKLIISGILLLLITHMLFIPPLLMTTYFNVQAGKALMAKDFEKGKQLSERSRGFYTVSKSLYDFARPTLLLFSLALYPEDVFQINEATYNIVQTSVSLQEKSTVLGASLTQKEKTDEEIQTFYQQKQEIITDFQKLHQEIVVLDAKIPEWNPQLQEAKKDLRRALQTFDTFEKIIPHMDTLFARGTTKKYLLLFANNMELRPGGGFIGSFGIVTIQDYTIKDLKIYDVYDADGQLTAHVEPPEAIKKHLNQPHWFLRDSAFSPDFISNYNQARFFLEKELNITDLNGGILLSTTTIQNVLEAMDELYVADFKETVTKENFYIKAQYYAENEFFPGSQQKKRFLGSVMDQLLIDLERASMPKMLQMVKKSLDEKQMVIYMNDQQVQTVLDDLYWSGRTITPQCAKQNTDNCVIDYVFPYDANLGVNKANFFVTRPVLLDITIMPDGSVRHKMTLKYSNDSNADVFPGGTYKNYLQIMLPKDSTIEQITNNNTLVENFDQKQDIFKTIGFLVEVQPKSSNDITIVYNLPTQLKKGNGTYQLILQKQIGSQNSELELKVTIPNSMSVVNKNFSPLVKDNEIIYNTTITSDKIFMLDVYRE